MHEEKCKKPELKDICELEDSLICAVKSVVGHGVFSKDVDAKELGEVVDMIKDMAETKRNCWEACYYESVVKAMEEYDEDYEGPYGYNPNRNAKGQYSSYNGRSGFFMPYEKRMPSMYPMYDDVMGYDGRNRGDVSYIEGSMGYDGRNGNRSMGYDDSRNRYGNAYREYEDARRHYTETKSMEDRAHMDEKAMEHVNNSMMSLREIWKDADPAVKKDVSAAIASLAAEFRV